MNTRHGTHASRTRVLVGYFTVAALVAAGLTALAVSGPSVFKSSAAGASSAPSSPPVVVCGNASLLTGPSSAPAGAVSVPAGDNSALFASTLPASTTYWFAAGTHTLGTGEYSQIDASNNDIFIGAPGAIISGQGKNDYAITGSGTNITIEYLTIEDFTAPQQEGVVNGDLAGGWTVENSTIENNPYGAGVIVDSNGVLNHDCLTENGQYGFQTYSGSDSVPVTNLTITNNEISYNDTQNYDKDGTGTCGCTGGGKFWNDLGATVTGNYVHDNESVGLWMDTNNTGFNVSDNYFSHNWDVAIGYEISYNVSITDNTFVDNAWVAGPNNPGSGAIEINNSGSDARVAGPYNTQSVVSGNVLTDNWGGIDIYEDADRYCGTQSDNTSNDYCTLVNPSVYTVSSCTANDTASATPSQSPDYFDNCRWKSQNILVTDNTINFTPSNIGSDCTAANGCGFDGVYSEYGTYPPYDGYVVPLNVVNNQNVVFSDNTYNGPQVFDSETQFNTVSWAQWTGGYTDPNTNEAIKAQDAGSTYDGSATTPTTTTTTVAPTTTTTSTTHPTTTTTHPTTTTTHPTTTTTHPTTTTTVAPSTTAAMNQHGYWLVGSDGGIFSFGAAHFYGSTGSLELQRPIVGISPTSSRTGYWLVASDGGIFALDSGFYGSIPGLGFNPEGSGLANSLNAPIVGMVPSTTGHGYFMVASDGGVFAFGDARFAGSCPGIGGCVGAAVAVVPDTTGKGYWIVTKTGNVYGFGDAGYFGAPGLQSSPMTSAVATPDGRGYYIVDGAGQVFAYGDATYLGSTPTGSVNGLNPATSIFLTADGRGYWIATALGKVYSFGDAPNEGDESGTHLNAPIIAAAGW